MYVYGIEGDETLTERGLPICSKLHTSWGAGMLHSRTPPTVW